MDYHELLETTRLAHHDARVRGWRDKEIDRELWRREAQETKLTSGQAFGTPRAERAFRRHTDPCRPHARAKKRRAAT
jgi:hypothetical protein